MTLCKSKIDLIRARTLLTDSEIAEKYGASVTAVRFLFADKSVRPRTAGRLAKALGVDVVDIVVDVDKGGVDDAC